METPPRGAERFLSRRFLQAPRRWFPPGLWEGPPADLRVALTIDDGPHPDCTPSNLAVLRRLGAPAAFFLVGERAERHPDLVRRIADEGHEIGNHTWSHRPLLYGAGGSPRREIDRTEEVLERLAPGSRRFFRPPFGALGPGSGRLLAAGALAPVYWSLVPGDWDALSTPVLLSRVLRSLHPGAVLVLHGGQPRHQATALALESLIQAIRDRGYEFATLSEMMRPLQLDPGVR